MRRLIPTRKKSHGLEILAVALLIAGGILLRLLFLTADPPKDITISGGIIGDPGQYQYGARNQLLFGQPVLDGFAPHLFSPLIHPLNIFVYSAFGINLTTHRLIPLVFSILILLLFWVLLRRALDSVAALAATVFLGFSYPVIVYSHVAYREYPMTFFSMLSLLAFAKGGESKRIGPFICSALFFIFAFLSKGSGIFLLAVFIGVGVVWLLEKRIDWRQLTAFAATLAAGFVFWWLALYIPNKEVLKTLLSDNSNVRRVESLTILLQNLWSSPMMIVLRNDPVLFLVSAITLFWLIRERFSRPKALPPIIDIAFAWLMVGSLFHGIVSYRPTRFYLMLVLPAALIAGYGLSRLVNRKRPHHSKLIALLPTLPLLALVLTAMGFPAYLSMVSQWPLPKLVLPFFISAILLYLFLFEAKLWLRYGLVALVIVTSLACNLNAYRNWAGRRQYEIPAIVEILARAIPPSRIAGNWAAHLSIGTPHRTYFAWPGFFNWQNDFLARNQIEYLLLARHRNFDEISFYRDFFREEWSRSQLMAEFDLNNAKVQLIRILPKNDTSSGFSENSAYDYEAESLPRTQGCVRYSDDASQKMVVTVPDAERFDLRLPAARPISIGGIAVRARGRFSLQIVRDEQPLTRVLISASKDRMQEIRRSFDPPLDLSGKTIFVRIENLDKRSTIVLDRIRLTPPEENRD